MNQTVPRSELVSRIARLAESATNPEDLERFNLNSSRYRSHLYEKVGGIAEHDLVALGRPLALHLGFDPEGTIHIRGGGGYSPPRLAERVVARARTRGAEGSLSDFERLCDENAAEQEQVIALWGIHPRVGFEVWQGIELKPLVEVAPSLPRDLLLGIPSAANVHEDEHTMFSVRARPTAALTCRVGVSPVVSPEELVATDVSRLDQMQDIARCLTLVSQRPIAEISHWSHVDLDVPLIGGIPDDWGGQAVIWGHQFDVEQEDLDIDQVRSIVAGYMALPDRDHRQVHIVLDRLSLAKSGISSLESQAIDLGTAIEALLFDPDDKSDQAEISFKFKVRGALLLTGDTALRKATMKQLDGVYELRSRAAHGGVLSNTSEKKRENGLKIVEGIDLATSLVLRVIGLGSIPRNWNDLILGAAQLPHDRHA